MNNRKLGFALGGFAFGFIVATLIFLPRHGLPEKSAGSPQVVALSSEPAFPVYLAGQVHREGAVEIDPNRKVTVTQTIIMDGGVAALGDARRVVLMRRQADGTSRLIPVDFNRALLGKSSDPVVHPGDLINVPQRLTNF